MGSSIWAPDSVNNPVVNVDNTIKRQNYIATAGQTVFTLTEYSYTPNTNSLFVFVNGFEQPLGISYTETDATTITFLTPCSLGDVVEIVGMIGTTGATAASEAAAQALVSQNAAAASALSASNSAASAAASAEIAGDFIAGFSSTSSTNVTLALTNLTFQTQPGKLYDSGTFVTVASLYDPNVYMAGQVYTYIGTTLIVTPYYITGPTTTNAWLISISGIQGPTGPQGTVAPLLNYNAGVI